MTASAAAIVDDTDAAAAARAVATHYEVDLLIALAVSDVVAVEERGPATAQQQHLVALARRTDVVVAQRHPHWAAHWSAHLVEVLLLLLCLATPVPVLQLHLLVVVNTGRCLLLVLLLLLLLLVLLPVRHLLLGRRTQRER